MYVDIRWLIRRDMPEIVNIENMSHERPWSDEDFLMYLRQRNCIGMVAESEHRIVGYMVYELENSRLNLLNMSVAKDCRRFGVGRQMVERLQGKLSQQRRIEILASVPERSLEAQLFFASQGFMALGVDEDFYQFRYRLPVKKQARPIRSHED